jgi:hypothetical protein
MEDFSGLWFDACDVESATSAEQCACEEVTSTQACAAPISGPRLLNERLRLDLRCCSLLSSLICLKSVDTAVGMLLCLVFVYSSSSVKPVAVSLTLLHASTETEMIRPPRLWLLACIDSYDESS